jgi:hypothetical protein
VKLTTHINLVPKLRKPGKMKLLYVFKSWCLIKHSYNFTLRIEENEACKVVFNNIYIYIYMPHGYWNMFQCTIRLCSMWTVFINGVNYAQIIHYIQISARISSTSQCNLHVSVCVKKIVTGTARGWIGLSGLRAPLVPSKHRECSGNPFGWRGRLRWPANILELILEVVCF